MAKPGQSDSEIIFVPDCQAASGAAVAMVILPTCPLATFHTVSKGHFPVL